MITRNQLMSRISRFCFATIGLGVVLAFTGCPPLNLDPFGHAPLPAETEAASAEKYQVVLTGLFGKTTAFEGTIDGPITVQTAIEKSGATTKYRGMDIVLMRAVEGKYQPLKMPVEYIYRDQTVRSSQDYALHNGDRILIKPQSNSMLDKVVDSVTGGAF